MNDFIFYSIVTLVVCFGIAYYLLSRIDSDIIPESYDAQLDPFWTIWGVMLIGGVCAFHFYPENADMIYNYKHITFILPLIFAILIYFCYLFEFDFASNALVLYHTALCIARVFLNLFCCSSY